MSRPTPEDGLSLYREVVQASDGHTPPLMLVQPAHGGPQQLVTGDPRVWGHTARMIESAVGIDYVLVSFDALSAKVDPSLLAEVTREHVRQDAIFVALLTQDDEGWMRTQVYDRVGGIVVWGVPEDPPAIAGTVVEVMDRLHDVLTP